MKYKFVEAHTNLFPIEKMCIVLKISSSGYYRWKKKQTSGKTLWKQAMQIKIKELYFTFKQRYGSPRIAKELNILGYKISRITVAKYMKELGLRSKVSKKFKVTTDSKHNYLIVDNVLNREFSVTQASKVWVSDITYIRTKEGFLYLTIIMDVYDRKIIGWSLSDGLSTDETTLAAWKMAVKNRMPQKGLIFHSDRGTQYACNPFVNTLEFYKVTRSMSRKGDCWDNAVAESFFKSFKSELIYENKLIARDQMKLEIFQYIEIWYNQTRRHSALNYMTINEFNSKSNFYSSVA